MSAISSPLEPATRSAMLRTFCSSKAIFSITCAGIAALILLQRKSGLAPTGVLRQFLRTTTQQFSLPTIRLRVRKDKPARHMEPLGDLRSRAFPTVATREHPANRDSLPACDYPRLQSIGAHWLRWFLS